MAFRERGRGRRGVVNRGGNAKFLEEVRRLQTRLETLDVNRQQDPVGGDVSDNEEDLEEERKVEAYHIEVRLLKSVIGASMRPKLEVPTYQ